MLLFTESGEYDEKEQQFLIKQLKMKKTNETEAAVPETKAEAEVEPVKDEDTKKFFDEIVFGRIDEVSWEP